MIQSFNEKSVEVTEPLKIMLGWVGNFETRNVTITTTEIQS